MNLTYREMQTHADRLACVALQKETWGHNFTEIVPPTVLQVAQKIGGLAAGAFDDSGEMVGFVFGQTGYMNGHRMNWSQMLAVKRELRRQGVGLQLKLYQRDWLLQRGIEYAYWTYDPMVARNGHINFNKLGVVFHSYVEDMYPADNGSELHQGMSLDRFVVQWPLNHERVQKAIANELQNPASEESKDAPIVNAEWSDGQAVPVEKDLPNATVVRVAIPADIETILRQDSELAKRWRHNTRRAFVNYTANGYEVTQFCRDGEKCFYVMRPLRHQEESP